MTGESLRDNQKELELERIKPAGDVKRFERLLHVTNISPEELDNSIEELRALRRRIYLCDQQLSKINGGEIQTAHINQLE
jgi:hypothetical protein